MASGQSWKTTTWPLLMKKARAAAKITRVNAGEGVVKEFIRAGGIVKWRNLEDQGNETTT